MRPRHVFPVFLGASRGTAATTAGTRMLKWLAALHSVRGVVCFKPGCASAGAVRLASRLGYKHGASTCGASQHHSMLRNGCLYVCVFVLGGG